MNIENLNLFPAMIVVSNEQEREREPDKLKRRTTPTNCITNEEALQKQRCYAESHSRFYPDLNTMPGRGRLKC